MIKLILLLTALGALPRSDGLMAPYFGMKLYGSL